MNRGDILIVRSTGGAATKARPCVVVQRSSSLNGTTKLTACPISSTIRFESSIRPLISSDPETGLRALSQVEVDWIFTEPLQRFGPKIGSAGPEVMRAVDVALRLWLDV